MPIIILLFALIPLSYWPSLDVTPDQLLGWTWSDYAPKSLCLQFTRGIACIHTGLRTWHKLGAHSHSNPSVTRSHGNLWLAYAPFFKAGTGISNTVLFYFIFTFYIDSDLGCTQHVLRRTFCVLGQYERGIHVSNLDAKMNKWYIWPH